MTEPFYGYKTTNNTWQEFQGVFQTMRWEEVAEGISDTELAGIENDTQEVRVLLEEAKRTRKS